MHRATGASSLTAGARGGSEEADLNYRRMSLSQLIDQISQLINQITHWSGWGWSGWGWPGWIALGALATGAIVVALLAGFGKTRARAQLEVFVDPGPPGKIRVTSVSDPASVASYYCRLRIANRGTAVADGVEVQMLRLRRRNDSNAMVIDPVFLPLDLRWSFDQEQRPRLLPGVHRFCDLVHIDDWSGEEDLPTLVFHSSMYPAFPNELRADEWPTLKPPGEYELDIGVAAGNAETIRRTISIRFSGTWYDDEAEMFTKGLVVQRK